MNKRLREFERESGLEIFGLGAKRDKWEQAMTKYAELIILECALMCLEDKDSQRIVKHFGVEE
jgi:hypothetical protein